MTKITFNTTDSELTDVQENSNTSIQDLKENEKEKTAKQLVEDLDNKELKDQESDSKSNSENKDVIEDKLNEITDDEIVQCVRLIKYLRNNSPTYSLWNDRLYTNVLTQKEIPEFCQNSRKYYIEHPETWVKDRSTYYEYFFKEIKKIIKNSDSWMKGHQQIYELNDLIRIKNWINDIRKNINKFGIETPILTKELKELIQYFDKKISITIRYDNLKPYRISK